MRFPAIQSDWVKVVAIGGANANIVEYLIRSLQTCRS